MKAEYQIKGELKNFIGEHDGKGFVTDLATGLKYGQQRLYLVGFLMEDKNDDMWMVIENYDILLSAWDITLTYIEIFHEFSPAIGDTLETIERKVKDYVDELKEARDIEETDNRARYSY